MKPYIGDIDRKSQNKDQGAVRAVRLASSEDGPGPEFLKTGYVHCP